MIVMNCAGKPQSSSALIDLCRMKMFPLKHPFGMIPVIGTFNLIIDAQNKIEKNEINNRYLLSLSVEGNMNAIVKQLTKEEYVKIVQANRRQFVHEHFGDVLIELFEKLRLEANKMRNCHFESKFTVPEHFDVDKTETLLREYFRDIGYETIAETRKDGTTVIVLTLT